MLGSRGGYVQASSRTRDQELLPGSMRGVCQSDQAAEKDAAVGAQDVCRPRHAGATPTTSSSSSRATSPGPATTAPDRDRFPLHSTRAGPDGPLSGLPHVSATAYPLSGNRILDLVFGGAKLRHVLFLSPEVLRRRQPVNVEDAAEVVNLMLKNACIPVAEP